MTRLHDVPAVPPRTGVVSDGLCCITDDCLDGINKRIVRVDESRRTRDLRQRGRITSPTKSELRLNDVAV
jgi:hypothetical protein